MHLLCRHYWQWLPLKTCNALCTLGFTYIISLNPHANYCMLQNASFINLETEAQRKSQRIPSQWTVHTIFHSSDFKVCSIIFPIIQPGPGSCISASATEQHIEAWSQEPWWLFLTKLSSAKELIKINPFGSNNLVCHWSLIIKVKQFWDFF